MSLELKYRPKKFEDVAGNKPTLESLKSILAKKKEDWPNAFLFFGERGCGKTSVARITGTTMGCPENELLEYNMANLKDIGTVRDILERSTYATLSGNPRIYIFDECHKQLKDSQEAFLKFLEEPPENVYSILCTTNPERLLPTIISRCSSFQFKTLKLSEIPLLLNSILEKEGFDSEEYPLEIKKEIARLSEGRPRDALKLLDAVIDMTDENEILEALTTVSLSEANIKELCQLLLEGKTWDFIRKQVMSLILDNAPEDVRLGIIFYMQKVLWNSAKNDRANYIIEIFSDPTYASGKPYLTSMFYRVCQK